jgi:hypothetical protein
MDINLPLGLSYQKSEAGVLEWFFTVNGTPVFPSDNRGVFLDPSTNELGAFHMVMRQWARTVNPVEEY